MSRRFAGIDIGSRTIELVVVDEAGEIVESVQADTGFDPMTEAKQLIDGRNFDHIMATGYGRNLFEISFDASDGHGNQSPRPGRTDAVPRHPDGHRYRRAGQQGHCAVR